jgi:hypothetical protein
MDYVMITGRAEISRLILAYAGVRYTDERLGQLTYLFFFLLVVFALHKTYTRTYCS